MKTEKAVKAVETSKLVFSMVKEFYRDSWAFKEAGKKICWSTVGDIVDLTNVYPNMLAVYPENFNASCASKQISVPLIEESESRGFSRDLCSYPRNTLGYMFAGQKLALPYPGRGMPEPDFLFGAGGPCIVHLKWWRIMQQHYNVPTFLLDAPYVSPRMKLDEVQDHYLAYTVRQLKAAFRFLAEQTGNPVDEDRLKEAVRLADEAARLWDEVLELRKNIPCPAGSEDMMSCIMPVAQWSGTRKAVDFYQKLLAEMQDRVDNKIGVIPEERFRILFENIPPWYTMGLFNYFHKFGAVCVAETYTKWFHYADRRLDPERPYESEARKIMSAFFNLSVRETVETLETWVRDWHIDGVVTCVIAGCKIYSGRTYHHANVMREKLGVPVLTLELDMVDPRDYHDAIIKGRIDAFMELMDKKKIQ
ncbi:2-hydroxyacyl-CoA dehydratase subunit D [Thermodesulfobacteriota bacterium]